MNIILDLSQDIGQTFLQKVPEKDRSGLVEKLLAFYFRDKPLPNKILETQSSDKNWEDELLPTTKKYRGFLKRALIEQMENGEISDDYIAQAKHAYLTKKYGINE